MTPVETPAVGVNADATLAVTQKRPIGSNTIRSINRVNMTFGPSPVSTLKRLFALAHTGVMVRPWKLVSASSTMAKRGQFLLLVTLIYS
jgi:hypothetical protein